MATPARKKSPARTTKPASRAAQSSGRAKTDAKPERQRKPRASASPTKPRAAKSAATSKAPRLLSGGNPQIAKADGDAPVQAYIAAMPGWKQEVGQCLDELIVRTIPGVLKAVRWNTPFYGMPGPDGKPTWFIAFHCITRYIKVTFFRGTSLKPMPPEGSKLEGVRYVHIYENEPIDKPLMVRWISQAAELPGEGLF